MYELFCNPFTAAAVIPLNFTINICISNTHVKQPLHLCYMLQSFSMTSPKLFFLEISFISVVYWARTDFLRNAPLMGEMMWGEMANQEEVCGLHWWPFVNDYVITASLINFAEGWINSVPPIEVCMHHCALTLTQQISLRFYKAFLSFIKSWKHSNSPPITLQVPLIITVTDWSYLAGFVLTGRDRLTHAGSSIIIFSITISVKCLMVLQRGNLLCD